MSAHQHGAHHTHHNGRRRTGTAVLHVGELHYASEKAVVERVLANRPGVARVEANPVARSKTPAAGPSLLGVPAASMAPARSSAGRKSMGGAFAPPVTALRPGLPSSTASPLFPRR
ncbi:MAG: hypothetical protein K0S82_2488, partial [Gaiellaceae bacterium]|nr:hypothetical protein [Gaiellaceae bacterium]